MTKITTYKCFYINSRAAYGLPDLLNQMPLLISSLSQTVVAPPHVLNEINTTLE